MRLDRGRQLLRRRRRDRSRGRGAFAAGAAADAAPNSPRSSSSPTLGAEQADIADIMLRAGIGAAGQVDVERLVERRCARSRCSASRSAWPLVSVAENLQPVLPVQAIEPAAHRARPVSRPSAAIAPPRPRRRRASGMSEISRFCQTVRRSVPLPCRSAMSARPRICAAVEPPDRQRDADIAKPGLALRVHADMAVLRRPGRAARRRRAAGARSVPAAVRARPRP